MVRYPLVRRDGLVVAGVQHTDGTRAERVAIWTPSGEPIDVTIGSQPIGVRAGGAGTLRATFPVIARAAQISSSLTMGTDSVIVAFLRGTGGAPNLTIQVWNDDPAAGVGAVIAGGDTTIPKDGTVYGFEIGPGLSITTGQMKRVAGHVGANMRVVIFPTGGVFPVTFGCDIYTYP